MSMGRTNDKVLPLFAGMAHVKVFTKEMSLPVILVYIDNLQGATR
jgi:hypothetical protein